jgi:RIO-like serine/threonine protein kinase
MKGTRFANFCIVGLLKWNIRAHGEAYENAGVLHRDMIPGNIMITEDRRGFLIDWDLAINTRNESESLQRVVRSVLAIQLPSLMHFCSQ